MITFEELSEAVYEDLNGRIATVCTSEKGYHVFYECDDWVDYDRRRRFELVFEGVPEATATPSDCGSIHATSEHPLLWDHNEEHVFMFFSSAPCDPFELVGRLYEAHAHLLGGWRAFANYLHADSELLHSGFGLLAEGPRRVIDEYAKVIGDALRYSIVHGHTPRGEFRGVLFDECYVIFRSVSVIEHELVA